MTCHILIKTKHSTTVHAVELGDVMQIMLPMPDAQSADLIVTLSVNEEGVDVEVHE